MSMKFAVPLVATLAAALAASAAQAAEPSERSMAANPTGAYQPRPTAGIDYSVGTWDALPLRPPPGLVSTTQSNLVGRSIYDMNGVYIGTIGAVLETPGTWEVRYVVASNSRWSDNLVIPFVALTVAGNLITADASIDVLGSVPRYSMDYLTATYPAQVGVVVPANPPPLASLPPVAPPSEPLRLAYAGSVVGYPVFDGAGAAVGRVQAVAVVPTTGEVRYAIVADPAFGIGSYIEVPAANARALADRVVVSGTSDGWRLAPRYTTDQVQRQFGSP